MPGPQPLPTKLKLVTGVKPYRINQNEPEPRAASATMPQGWGRHMSETAKRFWKRNAQMLIDLGLFTEIDLNAFRTLCETWADLVHVRGLVKKGGMVYTTINAQKEIVHKVRPEVKLLIDMEKQFTVYLGLFGMAPAPRGRISASPVGGLADPDLD